MKKLILILLLTVLVFPAEAQGYSSMNQEQLNLHLEKAKSKVRAGKTLVIIGSVVTVGGGIIYFSGLAGLLEDEYSDTAAKTALGGALVMSGGMGMLGAGIPIWITGNVKKEKVEVQLLKFKGSASAVGVGLNIRF